MGGSQSIRTSEAGHNLPHDAPHDAPYDAPHDAPHDDEGISEGGKRILTALLRGCLSAPELIGIVGISDRKGLRIRYLDSLISDELIAMTLPDKPRSKSQKYRLTEKGRAIAVRLAQKPRPSKRR